MQMPARAVANAIKVLPMTLARGELGHHYRKGWDSSNTGSQPVFDSPTQRLPEHTQPGELIPLRSGQLPYGATPGGRP